MPRFYFHVEDDRTTHDQEGTVLPDIEAARREAITVAGEMLRNGSQKRQALDVQILGRP